MENEEPAEVYILNSNNTNLSDTEMNDNKSNHIISVDEKRLDSDNRSEDYQACFFSILCILLHSMKILKKKNKIYNSTIRYVRMR